VCCSALRDDYVFGCEETQGVERNGLLRTRLGGRRRGMAFSMPYVTPVLQSAVEGVPIQGAPTLRGFFVRGGARVYRSRFMAKGVTTRLLWDLAPKFDQYLRQAGTVALQPWQQEIRDYVGTAKKPTLFAQNNLVKWGKRRGLV
jgi:hypothetical protein